jgi:hypothetical protein
MKNWQEIYFMILVVIALIMMFALPFIFPSEQLNQAIRDFNF